MPVNPPYVPLRLPTPAPPPQAVPAIHLLELLGNTLPLARTTFLLLPCEVDNEVQTVKDAVQVLGRPPQVWDPVH